MDRQEVRQTNRWTGRQTGDHMEAQITDKWGESYGWTYYLECRWTTKETTRYYMGLCSLIERQTSEQACGCSSGQMEVQTDDLCAGRQTPTQTDRVKHIYHVVMWMSG